MSNIIVAKNLTEATAKVGVRVEVNKAKLARQLDAHYTRNEVPVEKQMSKEDLAKLHAAIHYTHAHKQKESYDKMDEEETLVRPLPRI